MTEESFQERMKKVVAIAGNASSLSEKTGISSRSIGAYTSGDSDPSRERLVTIARAVNVCVSWLATGEGTMRPEEQEEKSNRQPVTIMGDEDPQQTRIPLWEDPDPEMFYHVPLATARLSAGGGMFVLSDDISDYYAFRKNWLRRIATSPNNVVLMTVQGSSMAPTIRNKDTVMIDTGRRDIIEGQVYALRLDETIMLKRLTHRPGGIVNVISDNKEEFETYQAKRSEIHIIGQIVFFCRDLVAN